VATNVAAGFSADIEAYIADETLPLARRQLVAYQFGDPLTLPKGRGTTYTATRYNRVPLPYSPLSEGVPPIGETMTIAQVSATAQQWGDKITITDVAELTIKHPLVSKAKELLGLQIGETLDRNTFNNIMAGTQVNYVNSRGARASLQAGDVLNTHEINRMVGALFTLGAPRYMGDEMTDTKLKADAGGAKASSNPRSMPHYVGILHPLVVQDMRENPTVVTAWSYSDLNRLYNYELGEWGGVRFCFSNMVPTWTGFANNANGVTYTPGTAGNLATNATYYIIVTGSDTQNQYESQIYAVSGAQNVVGPNGSITVLTPSITGFTYNVYIGTTTSPANLGLSTSGPTVGPLAGQAVQLPPATNVVITGIGNAQTPPAAPNSGITVYPSFVIGRGSYGQVSLDDVKITMLMGADKSDPLNQLRVVGWKVFYGTIIENQQFFGRIESTSAFSATFG
jgi:N4-gp56 family major capsid protein